MTQDDHKKKNSQSSCAFYHSTGLVDWSLDEPMYSAVVRTNLFVGWEEMDVEDATDVEDVILAAVPPIRLFRVHLITRPIGTHQLQRHRLHGNNDTCKTCAYSKLPI